MARPAIITLSLTLVLFAASSAVKGQTTSSTCTNVLIGLSPCLNYISGNSSTPTPGCCSQLASVVKSQPQCLCQAISSSGAAAAASLGIKVNRTQALELPSACNVQTPSISSCSGAASPSASASDSPSSDNSGSTSSTTPSSTASKESPSVDTSKAYAVKTELPMFLSLFMALFFLASSAY